MALSHVKIAVFAEVLEMAAIKLCKFDYIYFLQFILFQYHDLQNQQHENRKALFAKHGIEYTI